MCAGVRQFDEHPLDAGCQELVTLIDGRYAGDGSGLVVEYLVGDMRSDAKPSHARDASTAQIMEPPIRDARELVEFTFRRAETLKRLRAPERENEFPQLRRAHQHCNGLIREVHDVRLAVFGA